MILPEPSRGDAFPRWTDETEYVEVWQDTYRDISIDHHSLMVKLTAWYFVKMQFGVIEIRAGFYNGKRIDLIPVMSTDYRDTITKAQTVWNTDLDGYIKQAHELFNEDKTK
jgi:hypothetical protein